MIFFLSRFSSFLGNLDRLTKKLEIVYYSGNENSKSVSSDGPGGQAGRRAGGQVGRQGGRETEFGRQIRDGVPEYRGKQVRGFRRGAHDTGANERSAKLLNGCFLISVVER